MLLFISGYLLSASLSFLLSFFTSLSLSLTLPRSLAICTYIHTRLYGCLYVRICSDVVCFGSRQFGTKCSKCLRSIQATDWVRRAKDHVYHLACFACDSCKRQLSTGEEFALQDNRLLCKAHYIELVEGGPSTGRSWCCC